jgi:hypothetical protein
MNEMLIISELARFGQAIEERSWDRKSYSASMSDERLQQLLEVAADNNLDDGMTYSVDHKATSSLDIEDVDEMEKVIDTDDVDQFTGGLSPDQKRRINELLGQWEEPKRGAGIIGVCFTCGALQEQVEMFIHLTLHPFFIWRLFLCICRRLLASALSCNSDGH